jgi:hypothetical protein
MQKQIALNEAIAATAAGLRHHRSWRKIKGRASKHRHPTDDSQKSAVHLHSDVFPHT